MNNCLKITSDLLSTTSEYFDVNKYSIFHFTVSLIISQKISFYKGRNIRKQLFTLIHPDNEYTVKNLSKIDKNTYIQLGIESNKYDTILNLINLYDNNMSNENWINVISTVKGIGPWTINAIKIIFNINNNILLFEDLWIRKRFSELVCSNKILTCKECIEYVDKNKLWYNYRSQVSKFLWRINENGICAIKNNIALSRDHFV